MRLAPGCTCPAQEEELEFHPGVSCSLRPSPGAHPCPFLRNPGACLPLSSSDQSSSLKASLGFLRVRGSGWPLVSLCPQGAHTALLATSGCAGPRGGGPGPGVFPLPSSAFSLSTFSERTRREFRAASVHLGLSAGGHWGRWRTTARRDRRQLARGHKGVQWSCAGESAVECSGIRSPLRGAPTPRCLANILSLLQMAG